MHKRKFRGKYHTQPPIKTSSNLQGDIHGSFPTGGLLPPPGHGGPSARFGRPLVRHRAARASAGVFVTHDGTSLSHHFPGAHLCLPRSPRAGQVTPKPVSGPYPPPSGWTQPLGDRAGGPGLRGAWIGRGLSLPQSLTLGKEVLEGDITHQGLVHQQLGGHPSTAHGDQGTGRLCVGRGRERHSERTGPGRPPHNAKGIDSPPAPLGDWQSGTLTRITANPRGARGTQGTRQCL